MSVLTINPIGGLANRMRAIASGISLANALGYDYKIIWSRNADLFASFDDIFAPVDAIISKITYPSELKYRLLYSVPRKKNLFITALTLRRFGLTFIDNTPLMNKVIHVDTGEALFCAISERKKRDSDVFIQSGLEYYPFSQELYRALFNPSEKIMERAETIINGLGANAYGLHIRRTDNAMSIATSPDELFIDKINQILATDSTARFFLASDSLEVKKKLRNMYGDAVVFQDKATSRDSTDGMIDAVVDMIALSRTKHIYGSFYSSFSEAASMLSGVPLTQLTLSDS